VVGESHPAQHHSMRAASSSTGVLLGLLAAGCAGARSDDVVAAQSRIVESTPAPAIDERFTQSFEFVRLALEDGDDRTARLLLASVLARASDAATREVALRWVDVVDGRAVMAACDFDLEIDDDPAVPGATAVDLVITSQLRSSARLEGAPFVLTRTLVAIDRFGAERSESTTLLWEPGGDLGLPTSGAPVRLRVASLPLPRTDAIAMRETWRLEAMSGHVRFEGRRLPMRAFEAVSPRKEWLAAVLDRGVLAPDEFLRFVSDPASWELESEVFTARMLERVLRVPVARRGELRRALAALAVDLDDVRFALLVPALRWTSGADLGQDVAAWRAALDHDREHAARAAAAAAEELRLPKKP
jgi:hypothetical protein